MLVGILTSDQTRHKALASYIRHMGYDVFLVQERSKVHDYKEEIAKYFVDVKEVEDSLFSGDKWNIDIDNTISLDKGHINEVPPEMKQLLECDVVVVFGSSLIKGELFQKLSTKKVINLHMGISPEYIGSACNFWAMYDDNLQYVGGTIQTLSEKVDSGEILKYSYPEDTGKSFNPIFFAMDAVKSTIIDTVDVLRNLDSYFNKSITQNPNRLIRHSKISDFNVEAVNNFSLKKFNLENLQLRTYLDGEK
jgi:methionyl-tRNA formyltransferase